MKLFVTVLGLLMVVEGLPYFAFPERMQALMRQIQEISPDYLRVIGFISTLAGVGLCYLALRSGLLQ